MNKILNIQISSNVLKTIAVIAMVIDHIAFYFSPYIPSGIYTVCRVIGRIAMPIFTYLIVQGFFYTKNFKKYLLRITNFAVITQAVIVILMFINIKFVEEYTAATQVYMNGNILFSFAISLLILKLIHEKILIKKWDYNKNLSLKIIAIAIILLVCIVLPLDYGIEVIILAVYFYFIEKLKIQLLMQKCASSTSIQNMFIRSISDEKIKIIYVLLILFAISTVEMAFGKSLFTLLAIIPIALYNGERGKLKLKYTYYFTFVIQHALLYSLAMLITLT